VNGVNEVRNFLVGFLSRIYRPVAKVTLEVWAEANIWLGSKESIDNPGPYKRLPSVEAARLLDLFMNDPQWRTLLVQKSSQSGFTLHCLILICKKIAEIFTSIIYVIDSKPKATDLSRTRLQPMLRTCKATKLNVEASEDKFQTLTYELPNAILRLAGAGSAAQVSSFPADIVFGDELDKWPTAKGEAHNWLLLIHRIKKSEHGKAIGFSTPTTEDAVTHKCFLSGSQHRYFVPCPHCRFFQLANFDHLRFDHCKNEAGLYDLDRVMRETYMECESCKGRIEEDHKPEMKLEGEWRATNYRTVEIGGVKNELPAWAPGEMSAHVSDFYSIHSKSTWGIIACEFLQAQTSPEKLHNWTNGRAGLPLKKTVANITLKHILRLRSGYKRGSLPVVPCVATLQVDNQGDHQKWVSMGWLPNGSRYVIDYGKTLDREEIKEIAKRPIKTPERDIYVQSGIMDEGGKDGTSYEVRNFCYPLTPFFLPCKGRGGIQVKNTIYYSDSKLSKGGNETISVIHFDDDAFKRQLYIDLIKKFDPGKFKDFPDLRRLYLPSDIEEEFVRELCGEELVKELDANGVEQTVWKPKPPNDYGDCIKMGGVLWNVIEHKFRQRV
jgi:phage terminase large subunit GpA-like protein